MISVNLNLPRKHNHHRNLRIQKHLSLFILILYFPTLLCVGLASSFYKNKFGVSSPLFVSLHSPTATCNLKARAITFVFLFFIFSFASLSFLLYVKTIIIIIIICVFSFSFRLSGTVFSFGFLLLFYPHFIFPSFSWNEFDKRRHQLRVS